MADDTAAKITAMAYKWDVFLSYPRRDPVGPWVQDHLFPTLEKWLGAAMLTTPRIFIDRAMETGSHWPSNLRDSLLRARCMVAIWAPPYFGSRWCVAEWKSMLARENLLGLHVDNRPGLIYPIRFFDGETFPKEASTTQDEDFTPFNAFPPGKATLRSRTYRQFEARVQTLASGLAKRIASAPAWRANWPVQMPQTGKNPVRLPFNKVGLR